MSDSADELDEETQEWLASHVVWVNGGSYYRFIDSEFAALLRRVRKQREDEAEVHEETCMKFRGFDCDC